MDKLKNQKCKISYEAGGVNEELDDAIGKVLEQFGYDRYASGYTFDTQTRDLAFEKVE